MADAPITIKGAKVRIDSRGVTPVLADRDAVHAAMAAPGRSNRLLATADRQSIAMYVVALFRVAATLCGRSLDDKREWVKAGHPHFIVDAASMNPDMVGVEGWNDQAFVASALKWGAGIAGVQDTQVSVARTAKGAYTFYVVPTELKSKD
jgi:hypothetical protein